MKTTTRIELLEEYIHFLEKGCKANTVFLHVHGVRVPQSVIDEGERLRSELGWVQRKTDDDY